MPNTPTQKTLTHILTHNDYEALSTFMSANKTNNMEFFKHYNPAIFTKLSKPPTTHNLYFDGENLNIINLEPNARGDNFVYPIESNKHTMISTQLELGINPLKNPKFACYKNFTLHKLDTAKIPLNAQVCNAIIDLAHTYRGGDYCLPENLLPCTTIFGALGGIFLQILLERGVWFHSLLLFEEFVDMFGIMLYFVDFRLLFSRVTERACYIFIKDLIHKELLFSFFASHKISNNLLRLELNLYESPKINLARALVEESHKVNARGWGSFDDEMIGVRNTAHNLSKHYRILHLPKRLNVPICVVGNGASLESLLPFIQANADKMIIFSCGTALKPLKDYGIAPDFQIEIERIEYLKGVLQSAPLGDTPLLCGSIVNPSALELAKEAYIFMRGGGAGAYMCKSRSVVEFSAPFVGNAGFALGALMSEEVLICGLDCGYIQGKTKHAKGSMYGKESAKIPNSAFEVRGNGNIKVFSDALFSLSAQSIERAISVFAPRLVLNLGDGAYINGAKPCKPNEFELKEIDKNKALGELKGFFCADYDKVFAQRDFCAQAVRDFIEETKNAFNTQIKDKKELFDLVDSINMRVLAKSKQDSFVGLLFEGSIGHILQTLLAGALTLQDSDVSGFYNNAIKLVRRGLDSMVEEYEVFCQNAPKNIT